jgi:hypothetical protein
MAHFPTAVIHRPDQRFSRRLLPAYLLLQDTRRPDLLTSQ